MDVQERIEQQLDRLNDSTLSEAEIEKIEKKIELLKKQQ